MMNNNKNNNIIKGFTLVELLAVIVILAIIMIIAIPSVLNTMQTAKIKTMVEFAQKVYTTADRKYLEDTSFNGLPIVERGSYVYSIQDDLDLPNTGDYKGIFAIVKLGDDYEYTIILWNNEYVLMNKLANINPISADDIKTHAEMNEMLREENGEEFVDAFGGIKNLTKDLYIYSAQYQVVCTDPYYEGFTIVDTAKPNELIKVCD